MGREVVRRLDPAGVDTSTPSQISILEARPPRPSMEIFEASPPGRSGGTATTLVDGPAPRARGPLVVDRRAMASGWMTLISARARSRPCRSVLAVVVHQGKPVEPRFIP